MLRSLLEIFGIGRKARLIRMARKVRSTHRRLYGIAAGFYPAEFLTKRRVIPGQSRIYGNEGATNVMELYRFIVVRKFIQPRKLREYRKEYPR